MSVFDAVRRLAQAPGNPLAGRLSRRLLGWFLVFSLVPLLASVTMGYLKSQDIIERLVHRYLGEMTGLEARHVGDQINRHLGELRAMVAGNEFLLAGSERLTGGVTGGMGAVATPAAMKEHLQHKLVDLGVFDALYLLSAKGGQVLVAAGRSRLREEGLGQVAMGAAAGRDALALSGSEEGPELVLVVPVEAANGVAVAHLAGVISAGRLQAFLEIPQHLAGTVESFIVDRRGYALLVSHPHVPVDYTRPLPQARLDLPFGAFERDRNAEGEEVIATAARVPGTAWRFVTEVPVVDALGPLRQLRSLSIVFQLGLFLMLVAAAWLVAAGIVAPIGRLVEASRRVGRGDLTVRLATPSADEVGELTSAFNEMTGQLADASERVRALHQREIERAQQLATVGELASGVAHEIKNPVAGISSGLDLVKRRVGVDPALAPIMDEMGRQLDRIDTAVRDLLAFARPPMPALAPADANRIAERAFRLVGPAAEQAGVKLLFYPAPASPELRADEELVRQALVNLLMNAVQATHRGGRVTLTTSAAGDGTVVFGVQDTGRGITPTDREHVFKPFFTTRHSGTGLGLSITREIIERHGGRIELQSRVGHGTMFRVILPGTAGTSTTVGAPAEAARADDEVTGVDEDRTAEEAGAEEEANATGEAGE